MFVNYSKIRRTRRSALTFLSGLLILCIHLYFVANGHYRQLHHFIHLRVLIHQCASWRLSASTVVLYTGPDVPAYLRNDPRHYKHGVGAVYPCAAWDMLAAQLGVVTRLPIMGMGLGVTSRTMPFEQLPAACIFSGRMKQPDGQTRLVKVDCRLYPYFVGTTVQEGGSVSNPRLVWSGLIGLDPALREMLNEGGLYRAGVSVYAGTINSEDFSDAFTFVVQTAKRKIVIGGRLANDGKICLASVE